MGDSSSTVVEAPAFGWSECFALMKRLGFAPHRVLDIGANHGRWTRAAVQFFPDADYVLVEPQAHLIASIQDLRERGRKIHWLPVGVGERSGRSLFTLAPDDVSSNFGMSPEQAGAHGYRQAMVDVLTIDEIVARHGGSIPELVKIDAEGMELRVLDGAASILGKTEVIFVEVAVCAVGIPNTIAEVVSRMNREGYRLFDITEINRSPKSGALWLCELVFLLNASHLWNSVTEY